MKSFKQYLRQQIALEQSFPLDDELNEGRFRDIARKVGVGVLSGALIASPVVRPAGQSVETGKPTAARQVEKGGVSFVNRSTSGPAEKVRTAGHKHQTSYEITGQKDPKTGGPLLNAQGNIKPGNETMTINNRDLAGQRAVPGSVTAQKVNADRAKDTAPRTETRPGKVTQNISVNIKPGSFERTKSVTVRPKSALTVVPNLSPRDIDRNVPLQTGPIGVRRRRGQPESSGGTSTGVRTSSGGTSTGGGSSRTFSPFNGGIVSRIPSPSPKPTPSGTVNVPVSPQGTRRLQRVGGRLVTRRPGSVTVPATSKPGIQGLLRTMREEKYVKESDQLDEVTALDLYREALKLNLARQRARGEAQGRGQAVIDDMYGPTNTIAGRPIPPAASNPQADSSSYANAAPPTTGGTLTRINPNNTTPLVKGQPYSPSTPPAGGNMRKVRPGENPISEADVRGQTKFDFEGAKKEREEREDRHRREAAEDREFDRGMYRTARPVAPIKKPKKR